LSIITEIKLGHDRILRLVKGDITERQVDVIVNAANSYLKHGAGVAGAIVRKGGGIIQNESDKIGYVTVGSAAITGSGALPCNAIIHAVGPKMGQGNEDHKLRKTIQSALKLASERGFKTISIPAISAGVFGFPKDKCARILLEESKNFLKESSKNMTPINLIEFCILDDEILDFFKKEFSYKMQP
jgi:O-acetyl-ADP-ribose deacetylase (regulator of RNase III)